MENLLILCRQFLPRSAAKVVLFEQERKSHFSLTFCFVGMLTDGTIVLQHEAVRLTLITDQFVLLRNFW